jgi:uncharacterized protein (TIGR02996 family)
MDTTLAGLLQGCAESPDDSTPRVILADWLEDHGQAERAELVRVQCRLADWVPDWQERQKLIARQDELIAAHRDEWLGPLTGLCHRMEFVRGLCRVWVVGKTFASAAFDRAFTAAAPGALVERVRLIQLTGLGKVVARKCLALVPGLSLAGLGLEDGDLDPLVKSSHTARLVDLDLSGNRQGVAPIERLIASPLFTQLTRLVVRNNGLPEAGVKALLDAASPRLRELDATLNPLKPPTCKRLADRFLAGREINSLGMEFVRVRAGSFLMGAPKDEPGFLPDERPQHQVTLTRAFWLGRFAVTQDQYYAVMRERPAGFPGAHRPVEHVNWDDAQAFCRALEQLPAEKAAGRTYRLPTEAEREHACRAGTFSTFYTGPTHSMELMNCQKRFDNNDPERVLVNHPTDVGSYPPNPFGLYDMHGNVWEWCQDWFGRRSYRAKEVTDPTGPATGRERSMRGGCWEALGRWCRAAKRLGDPPTKRDHYTGFRVVLVTAE